MAGLFGQQGLSYTWWKYQELKHNINLHVIFLHQRSALVVLSPISHQRSALVVPSPMWSAIQ